MENILPKASSSGRDHPSTSQGGSSDEEKVVKLVQNLSLENNQEDKDEEEGINPLQIPHILLNVIRSVKKVKDLKNVRLVSKYWEDMAFEHWRSTATLQVYPNWKEKQAMSYHPATGNGLNFDELFYTCKLTGFKNMLPQFQENPFLNHKILDLVMFPPKFPESYDGLYWAMYGPELKHLHLITAYFQTGKEVEGFEWLLITSCRNLKELMLNAYGTSINFCAEEVNERGVIIAPQAVNDNLESLTITSSAGFLRLHQGFKELFDGNVRLCVKFLWMIPSLKELKILVNPDSILEALSYPSASTGNYLKLQQLEIEPSISLSMFSLDHLRRYLQLASPPIRVLKFCVNINVARIHPRSFGKIMKLIRDTVEVLELNIDWIQGEIRPPFFDDLEGITFLKLRELRLKFRYSQYFGLIYYLPVSFFRILKDIPNLEVFQYEFTGGLRETLLTKIFNKWDLDGHNNGSGRAPTRFPPARAETMLENLLELEKMKELRFHRRFGSDAFKIISKWMPHLEIIETVLDDETFPLVYQLFPKLEKVIVLPIGHFCQVARVLIAEYEERFKLVEVVVVRDDDDY